MANQAHDLNDGLITASEHSELTAYDEYRVGRDAIAPAQRQDVVPYDPPRQEIMPHAPNVGEISGDVLAMVRIGIRVVGGAAIIGTAHLVLVYLAALGTAGAASIGVVCGANPGTVAGFIVAVLVMGVVAASGLGGGGGGRKAGTGDEGEWEEFTQRQEQTFKRRKI